MKKRYPVFVSLLLCAGFCFAKKNAVPAGPFQSGRVLEKMSSLPMATAEISDFMPEKNLVFVVGGEKVLEIVDLKNPAFPKKVAEVRVPGNASSVSVHGDLVAVSLIDDEAWKDGQVQVMRYTDSLEVLGLFRVCSQPDMIKWTPNGRNLLVACEGSPSDDFVEDPEGGIAILSVPDASSAESWVNPELNVVRFDNLDTASLKAAGVRAPGTQGFVRSLEPEYITISEDSRTAWVSLQENNAIAKLDVQAKRVSRVFPLGYVDHSKPGFGLDAVSDKEIRIVNYPLRGLRQPDGIASFSLGGKNYVLTANEGAPVNDYKAWTDETTPVMLAQQEVLDRYVFRDALLKELSNMTVSGMEHCTRSPDKTPNGKCPYAYSFGSRSVSLFDGSDGKLLWDSGELFERMVARLAPDYFNWNSKKGKVKMDSRSPDKGCEPENLTVGIVNHRRYVFVGLERTAGIAVFDMTNLDAPVLVDFLIDPLDRGPEGILFIPADKSPLAGQALLIVGFEFSKSLTIYMVK